MIALLTRSLPDEISMLLAHASRRNLVPGASILSSLREARAILKIISLHHESLTVRLFFRPNAIAYSNVIHE